MKYFITYIFICLFIRCSSDKEAQPTKETHVKDEVALTPEQIKQAGIQTDTIRLQQLSNLISVSGQIEVPPQNIVSVSFPYNSFLKSTKLIAGMKVRKGEVLAIMEDNAIIQLQQDYLVTKTRLVYLEQDHQRQKTLQENNANAEKIYQQAANELKTQQILLKGYDEKLRLIGINPASLTQHNISRTVALIAPLTGYVNKVNVNIGKYVTASDILFELVNPEDIHATLSVYEKDVKNIQQGQLVDIVAVNDPETKYKASVKLVNTSINDNRNAEVHCHFSGPTPNLLPGMFVQAAIHVNPKETIAVPEAAIVRHGAQQYILQSLPNNNFKLVAIKTGITHNGITEIIDNQLPAGTIIVTNNAYSILSQLKNTADE